MRLMVLGLLLFCALVGTWPAAAEDAIATPIFPPTAPDQQVMNGIRLSDFKDFQTKWKMVTVTYRTDVSELRIAYADAAAYKALLAGGKDYPDGAKFAKVVFATGGDPAFINSMVPSMVSRYQFMVRDTKKYTQTDGWGYALFDQSGIMDRLDKDYEGHDTNYTAAFDMPTKCHTCHSYVKDRNFIFSRPMDMNKFQLDKAELTKIVGSTTGIPGAKFVSVKREDLPPFLRQFIPEKYAAVHRVAGDLGQFPFLGFIFEMAPVLMAKAAETNAPAVLYPDTSPSMYVVIPVTQSEEPLAPQCKEGERLFASYGSSTSNDETWPLRGLRCYKPIAPIE
jgi:hypothetical protein